LLRNAKKLKHIEFLKILERRTYLSTVLLSFFSCCININGNIPIKQPKNIQIDFDLKKNKKISLN